MSEAELDRLLDQYPPVTDPQTRALAKRICRGMETPQDREAGWQRLTRAVERIQNEGPSP